MDIKNIIFDLDGVIYLGDRLIEGADRVIENLEKKYKIFFLTNNATKSREQIARKLFSLGIRAREEQIISSAFAAAMAAKKFGYKYAYVIGEEGLKQEIQSMGINILSHEQALKQEFLENAVLISGLDRDFNYSKLKICLRFLKKTNKWIACNLDPNYPVEDGLDPGAGALAAAIAFSLGDLKGRKMNLRYPDLVVGKPSRFILDLFINKNDRKKSIFVGDRLDVDVVFAKKYGLISVLVLSGVSKKEDINNFYYKPDFVIQSVANLEEVLDQFSQKSRL
ncbi:MAG: HAD-IIA family hydrolase [Candidatus Anstonellaceae archaeon]